MGFSSKAKEILMPESFESVAPKGLPTRRNKEMSLADGTNSNAKCHLLMIAPSAAATSKKTLSSFPGARLDQTVLYFPPPPLSTRTAHFRPVSGFSQRLVEEAWASTPSGPSRGLCRPSTSKTQALRGRAKENVSASSQAALCGASAPHARQPAPHPTEASYSPWAQHLLTLHTHYSGALHPEHPSSPFEPLFLLHSPF